MDQQPRPGEVPEAAPAAGTRGLGQLVRVFYEPSAVFRELAARSAWVWPLVVVIALAIGLQLLTAPRLDMEGTIREGLERFGQADKLSAEQIREMAAARGPMQTIGGIVGTVVVIPLVMVVLAAIYLMGLRAAGSEAGFGKSFSLLVYASAPPSIVQTVLTGIVAMGRDSFTQGELQKLVRSSLETWLPPEAPKALMALGSVLDVFNVWYWVLLVLGLEIVGRIKRGPAIAIVTVLWGVYTLGKVGLSLLF
ncbi:MAG TPA: YIP1 family protein [Thermoanaerobaculaceae bacterium]|nr:YIP1 family protein [Thermoanaerobaculaceae bacterium]HRS14803.1 YIP1 family protein [Thermoanaerobaculaceae bacterium]